MQNIHCAVLRPWKISVKDNAPPRQLTHNFSQQLIATIKLSRFLTALTNETPGTISRPFSILFGTAESLAHCQHLYGNNKSRSIRSSKDHNMRPRSRWTGYLICGRLSRLWAERRPLLLPRVPNRAENGWKPTHLSHTWRFHTLAFSQPSRSHLLAPPARNSALISTPSAALLIGGYVLSCGRPGSE